MQELRFNPFHQIHQALRALMYHVSITTQHTDFTQAEQMEKTLTLTEGMVHFFEGHANTEDSLVFPMLSGSAPQLIAYFEEQHQKDHELGEELIKSIHECREAITPVEKILSGQRLQKAIGGFVAFNLTHMNLEETLVLSALWEQYTDEELQAKEAEIVASLSAEKKGLSSYWMLKGLATHEIIGWFKSIRVTAPAFVFDECIQLAERALPADKLRAVQKALQLSLA
jgi:hemerythrin-like domain-containing protein